MENRCRFLLEVYQKVRDTVGADHPVLIKLSAADHVNGGLEKGFYLEAGIDLTLHEGGPDKSSFAQVEARSDNSAFLERLLKI